MTAKRAAKIPLSETLYQDWLKSRAMAPRPLTPQGARPYASIWASWCAWLEACTPPRHFLYASAADLSAFLDAGPQPRASRRRADAAPVSEITRRRYWRVIDLIYRWAITQGLTKTNPAGDMAVLERPAPEKPIGQVFDAQQWAALRAGLPAPEAPWGVRDRAILLVLMDSALTNSELCQLTLGSVQPQLLSSTSTLSIAGRRKAQKRELVLGAAASKALADWLACRKEHALGAEDAHAPLFVTLRRRALTDRVLFPIVVAAVQRGFAALGLALPNHLGPQVLRNTRLVQWLNDDVELATVLKQAGLKDEISLRGLATHLKPGVLPEPTLNAHQHT